LRCLLLGANAPALHCKHFLFTARHLARCALRHGVRRCSRLCRGIYRTHLYRCCYCGWLPQRSDTTALTAHLLPLSLRLPALACHHLPATAYTAATMAHHPEPSQPTGRHTCLATAACGIKLSGAAHTTTRTRWPFLLVLERICPEHKLARWRLWRRPLPSTSETRIPAQ